MSPSSKALVVTRKTLRDLSSLRFLLAFFVPYAGLTYLMAQGFAGTLGEDPARLPLRAQELGLIEAFGSLSFLWAAGLPVMVFVAVLAANGIAKDEQAGTLRILLSKPISRRQVLLGKFLAVAVFGYLGALAALLLGASFLFATSGASVAALGGSIGRLLPGTLVYAAVVVVFVASVGTAVAVLTASRLKTALVTVLVPALFFGFLFLRVFTGAAGTYLTFRLYYADVNYHFGNVYVALQTAIGGEFSPLTQARLGRITGVFDQSGWGPDPLVGGLTGTVPRTGYVPAALSVALVVVLSAGLLALAVARFERKDLS